VCSALSISKSGDAGADEEDCKPVGGFDSDLKQRYTALGALSTVGGNWTKDLKIVSSSFTL